MDAHSVDALLVSDFINYVMHIEAWLKAEAKNNKQ